MSGGMGIAAPRKIFAERFAELFAAAGNPALRRVAAAAEDRMRAARGSRGRGSASAQRISDWKSGRNVPARFESLLPVLLTLVDQAKKSGRPLAPELADMQEWRRLWAESDAWRGESVDTETACPYPGLTSFRSADAALFFGRRTATDELADLIRAGGLLVVVGASGAGKSSLLHAGLVPAIASEGRWSVAAMTPGAAPVSALWEALAVSPGDTPGRWAPDRSRLLIVDQFEELFTAGSAESERESFLALLASLAERPADPDEVGPTAVVVSVRADFYSRCLHYPLLADALTRRSWLLGPMRLDELAEAITGPAEAAGLSLEPGLEELAITELCEGRQGYDAGALPLLSHVMAATWERREGARLTVAGYRKAGGVGGSVAATAERAWDELSPAQRRAAKQILLGLVRVASDSRDTRRRVARAEVVAPAGDPDAAEAALETLSAARLVTLDADVAYLTHEIVLEAWPRLRAWIDADRVGYLVRQRVEADAAEWVDSGHASWALYRGDRLTAAAEHCGPGTVGPGAREFLSAASQARRRSQRRSSVSKATLALLSVVALLLAIAAYSQSRTATAERNDAVFARVLSEADRLQAGDPSMSAQLDLVAARLRPDDVGVWVRLLGTQDMPLATAVDGDTGPIKQVAYRRDGRLLASAGHDNSIRLWDVADPRRPSPVGSPLYGHQEFLTSAVFSPDGRLLASAGGDHTVRLWDVTEPAAAHPVGEPLVGGAGTVYLLGFRGDGRILAAPNHDHTVALWDLADPAAPRQACPPLAGHTGPVRSAAFSPDGRLLATASDDLTVRLWDVSAPEAPVPLGVPLGGFGATAHSVAFAPDGRTLAAGSDDGTVRLWDLADPAAPRELGGPLAAQTGATWSVAFSPDGHVLATAGTDGAVKLWSLHDPTQPRQLGEPLRAHGTALTVAFSPDGGTVAAGGHDGAVRLWSPSIAALDGHTGDVVGPVFSADGTLMVTGSVGLRANTLGEGNIQVWNTADPHRPRRIGELAGLAPITDLKVAPDGRTVATVDQSASTVRLFDLSAPEALRPLTDLALPARYTYALAFRPDSRVLLTQHDDHAIRLWDLSDRARPAPLGDPLVPLADGFVTAAEFSPDGGVLAMASGGRGVLWDVSDPLRPRQIGHPFGIGTNAVRRLAFSPDGHTLVTGGDDGLRLWDIAVPARPELVGGPLATHSVASLAVSPDGGLVASGGDDAAVRLWDISDRGRPKPIRHSLALASTPSWKVAFHPGGRAKPTRAGVRSAGLFLAGSGESGVLRMWNLDAARAAARICEVTRSILTPATWRRVLPQLRYDPPCA